MYAAECCSASAGSLLRRNQFCHHLHDIMRSKHSQFRAATEVAPVVRSRPPPCPQLQLPAALPSLPLTAAAAAAAAATLLCTPSAHAETAALFERSCAGCHVGGSNIIRRDATLKLEDLEKNGVADAPALFQLIYSGKGSMPGYGNGCTPRGKCTFGPRLTDEEIQGLAAFVLANAQQGWKP